MSYLENFNFKISGPENGRKWVFLHGLMGYLNNWGSIVKALDLSERCLVYDQRGHGRSFKPAKGYSPADYAEDLNKITDELGWQKFILVGHSMGGRNAVHFAHKYPHKIEKLIVEDIGPESSTDGHLYYQKLLEAIPTPFASKEQAKNFFLNDFHRVFKTKENPEVLAGFLMANLYESQEGLIDWRFSPAAMVESAQEGRRQENWEMIQELQVQTLWMRGANSKELSPESFARILNSNKLIQGVVIPHSGHWIHSENKVAFIESLKSFVGGFDKT